MTVLAAALGVGVHFLRALWGLVPDNADGWTYLPLKLGLRIGASRLLWVSTVYTAGVAGGDSRSPPPRSASRSSLRRSGTRVSVMQLRRPLALTAGALVLSLGGLTSCGFDLATDRPYTPGEGSNDLDGQVDVLSALVVAAQPNEGTFVVTLANNDSEDDVALNGVAGPDLQVDEFEPVEVAPREAVNLATRAAS